MADWEDPARSEPPESDSGLRESDLDGFEKPDCSGGRRGFLRGLVAASPAILTVAGRPAWANRCTHSGNMSGNISAAEEEPCAGEGCSPGFWVTHSDLWHAEFGPNLLFLDVFGLDAYPGLTLFDVISQSDFGLGSFAARCGVSGKKEQNTKNLLQALGFQTVAALQNSANAVRYELTVADVQRTFLTAYQSCSLDRIEETKDSLDQLNNRYCPLPWG